MVKQRNIVALVQNVAYLCLKEKPVVPGKIKILFDIRKTSKLTRSLFERIDVTTTCSSIVFQRRNFKTDKSIQAESLRNPNIIHRIRSIFNTGKNKILIGHNKIEVTKNMLAKKRISLDEQQNIKLAFAEGYLAGHSKDGKSSSLSKHLFNLIVFGSVLFTLYNSISIRFDWGHHNEVDPEEIKVSFNDVKGVDEAKQELKDVVEFLKNPGKFKQLGGKLPKGVLLVGPPGTGKTLLARAVAGEAGVPFFQVVGAEFEEIFVGQGARRVRDLFKSAKALAPCVIFIDEIDSIGSKRTNSSLHPYANQTINQLLSEMDGFHQSEGVIVLGATNRREDLDEALLRPGRFDLEVTVPPPDMSGRKEIIKKYLNKIKAQNIDVDILARGTIGFTGADLENMINQAALKASLEGANHVTMKYLEGARDKVIMGPERKSRVVDAESNEITAYHEGGHAVVAYFTKDALPLYKVTIKAHGQALGHTAYIPDKEQYHVTKSQLLAMIDTMMGGRAAEELIFGPDKITSGASSDLKKATAIAVRMVTEWGMSEKVGLRTHENYQNKVNFSEISQETTAVIDGEVQRILQESYERAKDILRTHEKELKMIADSLLKNETLSAETVAIMLRKRP